MNINKTGLRSKKLRWSAFFVTLVLSAYWLMQLWLGPQVAGFSVTKGDLLQIIVAHGRVQSPDRFEITSKFAGKVAAVNVTEGQVVSAGKTLIVFENSKEKGATDKAKIATNQAAARLRQISERTQAGSEQLLFRAKTTLDNAKKQYARTRELSAKGLVSQDQLADSLRNLAIAQSQLASAQFQSRANRAKGSEFALAESALNRARANERVTRKSSGNRVIKAEADGILISRNVEQGDAVLPGKTLMVIAPSGKTQLIVQIDEKKVLNLKHGQHALIATAGHPDQRFHAELSYLNPVAESTGGTVEVKLDVSNPPDYLRQNMNVSVEIEAVRRTDTLSLAIAAIRDVDGAEPWVMLVDKGRALRRAVKLGIYGDAKVEILEGLREGDLVLPANGFDVEEGKRLRFARAG